MPKAHQFTIQVKLLTTQHEVWRTLSAIIELVTQDNTIVSTAVRRDDDGMPAATVRPKPKDAKPKDSKHGPPRLTRTVKQPARRFVRRINGMNIDGHILAMLRDGPISIEQMTSNLVKLGYAATSLTPGLYTLRNNGKLVLQGKMVRLP